MALKLQSLSRKILGKIGEDLPQSDFKDIQNLNTIKDNFPIFDFIAKKDEEVYVFSAKARKRYGANGKINPSYNILYNSNSISRKFKKALDTFTEMGYDTNKIHYCFLICPIEEEKNCIYYWGEFIDINPECSVKHILESCIPHLAVPVSDTCLSQYRIFGRWEWDYIKHKYMSSE
jgi:hypothetical protein